MEKQCKECGATYSKNPRYSKKQWKEAKFCSRTCQSKGKKIKEGPSPLLGRRWSKPKICSVCSEKNYKVHMNKPYGDTLCPKHYMQFKRHGKILWRKRKLITPLVILIRKCKKYSDWRTAVFERDNYTCVLCYRTKCRLEADHYPISFSDIFHTNRIKTFKQALKCKEFWNQSNGRTVCKECHKKTDNYGSHFKRSQ